MAAAEQWYYADVNNQDCGPVSLQQFRQAFRAGKGSSSLALDSSILFSHPLILSPPLFLSLSAPDGGCHSDSAMPSLEGRDGRLDCDL